MHKIAFFKNISHYFHSQTKASSGAVVCPKHRIEHTGKNVYTIIVDLYLWKQTDKQEYLQRAKKRAERTLAQLIKDADYGHYIFWPGRLEGRNMANSVIDSGACVDALSVFYRKCFAHLSQDEREQIKDAVEKVCTTYLQKSAVGKEVPNQRLWGATGLASAYRTFGRKEWKEAALLSVKKTLGDMWEDGTFPYHPNYRNYGIYRGIDDTTPYYHSRHIAFIVYILELLGEDLNSYRDALIRAADLLVGMYQPNGIKNMQLETKRWYWASSYEVASHSFDVYALVKLYILTGKEVYFSTARKAWQQLRRHQQKDGGITASREKKENFQCRIFWSAHTAWLARVVNEMGHLKDDGLHEVGIKHFSSSDIVSFSNKKYAALLRGAKKPQNILWGPRVGGGALLYFGKEKNGWVNDLLYKEWGSADPLNFYLCERDSIKNFWQKNKGDMRALLHYIKVELRAGNMGGALYRTVDLVKKIAKRDRVAASHFATQVDTKKDKNTVTFSMLPSYRDGIVVPKAHLKRRYILQNAGVELYETLTINNPSVAHVRYRVPTWVRSFSFSGDVRATQKGEWLHFKNPIGTITLHITL